MPRDQIKTESADFQTEYEVRLKKREQILAKGLKPYPAGTKRNETTRDCFDNFDAWEKEQREVMVAGRIRSIRGHGGLSFVGLEDEAGLIQIALKKDHIGEESYGDFLNPLTRAILLKSPEFFLLPKEERNPLMRKPGDSSVKHCARCRRNGTA